MKALEKAPEEQCPTVDYDPTVKIKWLTDMAPSEFSGGGSEISSALQKAIVCLQGFNKVLGLYINTPPNQPFKVCRS
jgi:hypothetical protein